MDGAHDKARDDTDPSQDLLALMTVLQQELAHSPSLKHTFDQFLPLLLKLTGSAYGFIGEVVTTRSDGSDGLALRVQSLTNVSWDAASQQVWDKARTGGVMFEHLQSLYGAGLTTGLPVIANQARRDPRAGGVPHGHPPLDAFASVPLMHGTERLGMVGLANRPGGYDDALLQRLAPLFALMGTLIGLRKADAARQAAEQALQRREALYRTTFEMAAVGIAQVSLDGRFLAVNARMASRLGRTQAELLDLSFQDLTHPDDLDTDLALLAKLRVGKIPHYSMEKRYLRPDGSLVWAMLTVGMVRDEAGQPDHFVSVIEDLTERRQAEQRLRERDDVLRKLSRFVPGVMFRLVRQASGKYALDYVSEGAAAMFGLDSPHEADTLRLMVRQIGLEDRAAMTATLEASARQHTPWEQRFRIGPGSAHERWLLARAQPETQSDGGTVWYGFIDDITERRLYETALINAEAAERANRAKTEFLSRMSHELRTPLNAVLGFAQLLRMDTRHPLPEPQLSQAGYIEQAGAHLLAMINDVLDISRIESGTLELRPEPVCLSELLDDTLVLLRDLTDKCQVTLQAQVDPRWHLQADRLRLKQVLLNLLSNAVKYNRPGGRAWAELDVDATAGQAHLHVSDDGPGLGDAQLLHLFEPFNRLGAERKRVEGTGIGLVIARGLAESMGGALSVRSQLGVGSCFSVTLPLAR
jgi:PAS domain S-box-containing protein